MDLEVQGPIVPLLPEDVQVLCEQNQKMGQLRRQKCWNGLLVRDLREVAAEAKARGQKVCVGRKLGICVENSKLGKNDPNWKFKEMLCQC